MYVFTVEAVYDYDDVKLVSVCKTKKDAEQEVQRLSSSQPVVKPERYEINKRKVIEHAKKSNGKGAANN